MRVFYLHGMGGNPDDWAAVGSRLPGRALPLPQASSFEQTAAALAGRLGQEREPFLLCGYSMGGRLALATAARLASSGSCLRALVLVAAGMGFANEEERGLRRESDRRWAALARADARVFWKKWYEQALFASFHHLPAATQDAWLKSRFQLDIEYLCHQIEALSPARHEPLEPALALLHEAGISVLYIVGEQDKKYLDLAGKLANVTVEVVPGAGHIVPLEAPGALVSAIRRFLRNQRP